MKTTKIPLDKVGAFSTMFLDYVHGRESLNGFYMHTPRVDHFKEAIEERNFSHEKRVVLQDALVHQYGPLKKSEKLVENLYSIQHDNTFTVTTGHQLNIFTGPLYFIFKIVTTINLARRLKEHYPDHHFVPVYWMASEDHDFEEISTFNLFGKSYKWETSQKGAVGRFAPQSLNVVLEQLPESIPLFEQAYLDSSTLADAVRFYVNELFGNEGLVVIDADDPKLKAEFTEVIKDDLVNHTAHDLVEKTNARLQENGYKPQAFARMINFFYLNGYRERIFTEGGQYGAVGIEPKLSQEEILKKIEEEPERFSPNVIMRPVYQETILPNLAYIGGPAEIVYWLQLAEVFKHYETPFPILMPRNFGMIINKGLQKRIEKLKISEEELFLDTHELKASFLRTHSDNEHILDEEKNELNRVFDLIREKAGSIDKSLEGFIGAEANKSAKALDNIEKRLKKAQETQNDTAMSQIDGIRDKLFPGGGLQERHDNFLNFFINNPELLNQLLASFDPFDFSFYQLWEE